MSARLSLQSLEARDVPAGGAADAAYEAYAWALVNTLRADPGEFADNLNGLKTGTVASAFGFTKSDPVIADLKTMIANAGTPEHYNQALALMRSSADAGPLAWDDLLENRAGRHNGWMRTNGFEHTGVNSGDRFAIPGWTMNDSAAADTWGYGAQFTAWGENIGFSISAARNSRGALADGDITSAGFSQRLAFLDAVGYMLELNSTDFGHLKNLLGRDAGTSSSLPEFNAIGFDIDFFQAPSYYEVQDSVNESAMSTQRFGLYRPSAGGFVTGLVFDDANRNRFYDVGEGMDLDIDVRNSAGVGFSDSLSADRHGAFSGFVPNGTYTVTYKQGGVTIGTDTVTVNNGNAWAQFTPQDIAKPTVTGPAGSPAALRPTATWEAVQGATGYQVRVISHTLLDAVIVPATTVSGTNWTPTADLVSGHSYGFQVRAMVGTLPGPWSTMREFTVARPTLSDPSFSTSALRPTLTWSAIAGAASYKIRVDDLSKGLTNIFPTLTATGTTATLPADLVSGRDYVVYVKAVNAAGVGKKSVGESISVARPNVLGPTTAPTNLRPTFTWSALPGVAAYEVRIHDLTKGVIDLIRTNSPGTSFTPEVDLVSGRSYSVQVRAVNDAGVGKWTTARAFSVAKPVVTGPTGTITDTTPTVMWTVIDGATTYRVQIRDLTMGTTTVVDVDATTYTPPANLTAGRRYQFAIAAENSLGLGALSVGEAFRIA